MFRKSDHVTYQVLQAGNECFSRCRLQRLNRIHTVESRTSSPVHGRLPLLNDTFEACCSSAFFRSSLSHSTSKLRM